MISILAVLFSGFMGFLGSLFGVLGAFYIYRLQERKEDKLKKDKQLKELEHKKKMLYTLLEFSYIQTRLSTKYAEEIYKNKYREMMSSECSLKDKYNLSGNLILDFKRMLSVKPCTDTETFDNLFEWISIELSKYMSKKQVAKRAIYIDNWYDYLDCISDYDDINSIVFWITIIKESESNIEVSQLISNRENIDSLIKKYYPEVIENGFRSKVSFKGIRI
ncbi:MAG: hypothetical protein ACRCXA_06630 [Peptostreptococcaceae bacterium]